MHGGTVLYLALENDKKRLQERMARMFGVEGCDNLHFATHAGQVGQNLDKQLQNFLREHPDTVLVITDTLQKVREMTTEGYSYASDYDVITSLKQLAAILPAHGPLVAIVVTGRITDGIVSDGFPIVGGQQVFPIPVPVGESMGGSTVRSG